MDTATASAETQDPKDPLDGLLPHHQRQLLEESGIAPELVRQRGYRSLDDRGELRRLGFRQAGLTVPGLLLPGYGPDGSNGRFVYRPDVPRVGRDGQTHKYELPAGSGAFLDVPPICAGRLRDPGVDLWITEGQKKGDAIASVGKCAVALLGVWMWVGKSEYGVVTTLPEWRDLGLEGRRVLLVPDSDTKHKPGVWQAMVRLKAWLESRGATVALVDVPDADDGTKQGVDDYLHRYPAGEREAALEQLARRPAPVFDGETFEWLDAPSPVLSRPLALIEGRAYAAAWIPVKRRTVDEDGRWLEREETARVVVRDDGEVFGPGGADPDDLGVAVQLAQPIREYHGWQVPAIKAFKAGRRPDVPDVFRRLVEAYDHFLDFPKSPGGDDRQAIMCEISACCSLATWLTPALTVVGYPWPNGPTGSGKTKWATIWARTSYLGELVLSSGTFASIRDLADYGGALAFDDAEGLADPKKADPYKRELLLAGHHRGTVVSLKEPAPDGRAWVTRYLDPFGFKAFTAIKLPDPVLASRSLIIPLVRTASEKANRDPADLPRWPHDRRRLQDDLWATGLLLLPGAAEAWAALEAERGLVGRDFEPWRPVLLAATVLEGAGVVGLAGRVRGAMDWYQREKGDLVQADRPVLVIRALLAMLQDAWGAGDINDVISMNDMNMRGEGNHDSQFEWTTADVTEAVKRQAAEDADGGGDEETRWITGRWVGRTLSQLRFAQIRDKKRRAFKVGAAALLSVARAYGLLPAPTVPPDGGGGASAHYTAPPPQIDVIHGNDVIMSPDPLAEACGLCGAPVDEYTWNGHARCAAHAHVVYLTSADALERELPPLLAAPVLGLDTETTGLDPHGDRLRLVQLAAEGRTVLVDAGAVDAALLAPLFGADPAGPLLVGHNLGFDLQFLAAAGLPVPAGSRLFDTMLAAQVGDCGEHLHQKGRFTLEALARRVVKVSLDKTEQAGDWAAPTLTAEQLRYAAGDAEVLLPLAARLEENLTKAGLRDVAQLEFDALPAVAWLERTGALIDRAGWEGVATTAEAELPARRAAVEAHARSLGEAWLDVVKPYTGAQLAPTRTGKPRKLPTRAFNPDSHEQQLRLLQALGVDVADVREDTLAAVRERHPVVPALLALKATAKLATAFGRKYLEHVHPQTGRIHARYAQLGSEAGRMSCRDPNLQQVPHDPRYRACFVAPPGRRLIKADYAQIELAVVADLAADERMLAALNAGGTEGDLHRLTAAALYGKAPEDVTPQERAFAKTVNFGALFGLGARGLQARAAAQGIALDEAGARAFLSRFDEAWPQLARWRQRQLRSKTPAVVTVSGRRRMLPADARPTFRLNTPVQGTAADGFKAALAQLWTTRERCPSGVPVLAVHDELVVEADAAEADAAVAWVTDAMVTGMRRFVTKAPVRVEATVSPTWGGAD